MSAPKPRRRGRKAALLVLAILALAWSLMYAWPKHRAEPPRVWSARANGAPLVIAHQGGNQERPSESNLAFEHAASIGVDAFELDVALTADGMLAVIHDLSLDRTTNGSGPVRAMSYEAIRQLDAGYGLEGPDGAPLRDPAINPYIGVGAYVPHLEELFKAYPAMPMLIELKDSGADGELAAAELWRLIEAYGRRDTVLVASFHGDTMKAFKSLSGGSVARSAPVPEATAFWAFHALGLSAVNNGAGFNVLNLPLGSKLGPFRIDLCSRAFREDARHRGIPIHYWTINRSEDMIRLAELGREDGFGVDGIITDRPSQLLDILRDRGLR